MTKILIKILYFFISAILGFILLTALYQIGAYDNQKAIIHSAINDKDYLSLAKTAAVYSLPLDGTPSNDIDTGKGRVLTYNSINQVNLYYYDGDTKNSYAEVQNYYYFYIIDPQFDYKTNVVNDRNINYTSLVFYNEAQDRNYEFKMYVNKSEEVNAAYYHEKPSSPSEALMYSERNMATTYTKEYGFMYISISELFVSYVEGQIGGSIKYMNFLDSNANKVLENNFAINMSFSEQFFTDLSDFVENHNIANLTEVDYGVDDPSTLTQEQKTKIEEEFKKTQDAAISYVESYKIPDIYTQGYGRDVFFNAALAWRTVGIGALYVLAIILVFFLLFYFKKIQAFVFRTSQGQKTTNKRQYTNKTPNFRNNNVNNYNTNKKGKYSVKEDSKKEEPKEEAKEEPKADVLASNEESTDSKENE